MSWDAIGAVAEILGAIAVFITLVFLSLQIRQNTRAVERESTRANLVDGSTWMYKIIQDPEIARIYREGLSDSLEDQDDKMRFNLLMQALFDQWSMGHAYPTLRGDGFAEADVKYVLSTPGGMKYWERAKDMSLHHGPFNDYLETISQQIRGDA